jgi:antitoxin component of MazEF toxin-antitoxin module
MRSKVVRIGDEYGVVIPDAVLKVLGWADDEHVVIEVVGKRMNVRKAEEHER